MASAPLLVDQPFIAEPNDREVARRTAPFFESHLEDKDGIQVTLDGHTITLPRVAVRTVFQLLHLLANGESTVTVTVIPSDAQLTTQQAADYLNVSRPYFIKEILEKGKLAYDTVGRHRRVRYKDLEAFKQEQDRVREDALNQIFQESQARGAWD
jgi:excisionase family DNA binding protein